MVTETLAWDDLTGMQLDRGKVKETRQKEIEYVRKKEDWKKISRRQAIANGWKIIKNSVLSIFGLGPLCQ